MPRFQPLPVPGPLPLPGPLRPPGPPPPPGPLRLLGPVRLLGGRARRVRATAAALAGLALIAAPGAPAGHARADERTVSADDRRTGWDLAEPALAPARVSSASFGRRWSVPVDGGITGQPLVAGSTVVTATETDHVYGVDAADGRIRWQRRLGTPVPSATDCFAPGAGITSTPVFDAAAGTVYLVARSLDGGSAHFSVHALDVASGAERAGWPVEIGGDPVNSPGVPFDAATAAQRPGLLLLDGVVYAGFASDCDLPPYVGQVAAINTGTRAVSLWSTEAGSASQEAGIWMSGGGLVSDGPGRIFLATGNGAGDGSSPARGPGDSPGGHLGDSVVRLGVGPDGRLAAEDFFSPTDNRQMDHDDLDLGSAGPTALPAGFGTPAHPHLLVQPGKDGRVFLLDRDHLGGMGQGPDGTDDVLATAGPFHGYWGHPGVWGGDGGYVYLVDNSGPLRALKYTVGRTGTPQLTSAGTSREGFGYASGSPVVTSDGTRSGSALVWTVYSGTGPHGQNGELRVYDPLPTAGTLHLRRTFPLGTVSKFSVPATDNGRVIVGTNDGHLIAFGSA